jgi:hypothetical protein
MVMQEKQRKLLARSQFRFQFFKQRQLNLLRQVKLVKKQMMVRVVLNHLKKRALQINLQRHMMTVKIVAIATSAAVVVVAVVASQVQQMA